MPEKSPRSWFRRFRAKVRRLIYHDILHADDPPHNLALGVGLGLFVAFTPTVGIQMLIAGFLSWLLRANKAVSMAMVWISNPATLVPIYWYSYRIGCLILAVEPIGWEWWQELTTPPDRWWPAVKFYWTRFVEVAGPLWLGGCLVGIVVGCAMYNVTYHLIRLYRAQPAQGHPKTIRDPEGS